MEKLSRREVIFSGLIILALILLLTHYDLILKLNKENNFDGIPAETYPWKPERDTFLFSNQDEIQDYIENMNFEISPNYQSTAELIEEIKTLIVPTGQEISVATEADVLSWIATLQETYITLGFANQTQPLSALLDEDDTEGSYMSLGRRAHVDCSNLTLTFYQDIEQNDRTLLEKAELLFFSAHENAHIHAQKCITPDTLTSEKYFLGESTAQLMALESLAYLYYFHPDEEFRQLARLAFLTGFAEVNLMRYPLQVIVADLEVTEKMELLEKSKFYAHFADVISTIDINQQYRYGELPLQIISRAWQAHNQDLASELNIEQLMDDPTSILVNSTLSFEYTLRLLEELGWTQYLTYSPQ